MGFDLGSRLVVRLDEEKENIRDMVTYHDGMCTRELRL